MQARTIDLSTEDCYQSLLAGSPETCGMRSGRQALKPGEECGEHSTKGHEEVLVILHGTGLAKLDDGSSLELDSGRIAYIPPHTVHNIVNTGPEVLRYIYVVAPARHN